MPVNKYFPQGVVLGIFGELHKTIRLGFGIFVGKKVVLLLVTPTLLPSTLATSCPSLFYNPIGLESQWDAQAILSEFEF